MKPNLLIQSGKYKLAIKMTFIRIHIIKTLFEILQQARFELKNQRKLL